MASRNSRGLLLGLLCVVQAVGGDSRWGTSLQLLSMLDSTNSTSEASSDNATSVQQKWVAATKGGCPTFEGMATITVREVFWSVPHSLEVIGKRRGADKGERLGYITSKLFTVKTEQEWLGKDGTFIAGSHKDLINAQLVPVVHISDCRNLPIAAVEETMVASMTSSILLYTVRNMKDDVIASSRNGELLGREVVRLSDTKTGTALANIYKGTSRFYDEWTADFTPGTSGLAGDVRVMALMLAGGSQDLAFGMGPMPFIMFLLCMAGAGMCCCFMNRKRLLEWAASGGRGEYDEIYED